MGREIDVFWDVQESGKGEDCFAEAPEVLPTTVLVLEVCMQFFAT